MTGIELPGLWAVLECDQPARYAEITRLYRGLLAAQAGALHDNREMIDA
jgi:hypothetical protein